VRLGVAVAFLLLSSSTAFAEFLNGYSDWQGAADIVKYAYVEGLYDSFVNNMTTDDQPWVIARRAGVEECALALKISPKMISDAVTTHYQTYNVDWAIRPSAIFGRVMQEVCITYINAARRSFGLSEWKTPKGSLLSND